MDENITSAGQDQREDVSEENYSPRHDEQTQDTDQDDKERGEARDSPDPEHHHHHRTDDDDGIGVNEEAEGEAEGDRTPVKRVQISSDVPPTPTPGQSDPDERRTSAVGRRTPVMGRRSPAVSTVSDFRSTTDSPTKTIDTCQDGAITGKEDVSDVEQENVLKRKKRRKVKPYSGISHHEHHHHEQEERHIKVRDDLVRLRNYYYSKYMVALEDKVQQQRDDIQKRSKQWEEKQQEAEEREHQRRLDSKPKFTRSEVTTDVDYMRNVSKSVTYEICAMQDKLEKKGELSTREEVDNFWGEVLMGPKWGPYFRGPGHRPPRASEASTGEGGKGTAGARVKFDSKLPTIPSRGSSRRKSISKTQSTLDALFPHTDFPHLKVYEMELKDDEEDPRTIAMRQKRFEFTKQQKIEKLRLLTMYERSFTNHAATTRILGNHQDMENITVGSHVCDLMSHIEEERHSAPVRTRQGGHHHREGSTFREEGRSQDEQNSRKKSGKSGKSERSHKSKTLSSLSHDSQRTGDVRPLTMTSILPHCHIKEAKCVSTVWINYAKFEPGHVTHESPNMTPVQA